MYYVLSHALTRRFIEELRGFWSYHPRYRDDLVNNIQGKYAFDERPQHGIIVKNSGGSLVKMAADNFIGTVHSHAYLTKVDGFNGTFIEWVREDAVAIQRNGGIKSERRLNGQSTKKSNVLRTRSWTSTRPEA